MSSAKHRAYGETLLRRGKIDESLFSDGLHPNEQGYRRLGEFISKHIEHDR
jgi:lysophospholipase L1-like esterase